MHTKGKKGISPIVAIVLLIAIAIIAAIGIYYWTSGLVTKQPTSEAPIPIVANPIGNGKVLIANLGTRTLNTTTIDTSDPGVDVTCESETLGPGEQTLCTLSGTSSSGTITIYGQGSSSVLLDTKATNVYWAYKGWSYRQKIIVTENSGNDLSEYQVRIVLNSSNVGENLDWNSDENALRFTHYNAATGEDLPIPFWIESWDSAGQQATIWVKVPSIPANDQTVLYMYYGNPSTISASNLDDTFVSSVHYDDMVDFSKSSDYYDDVYINSTHLLLAKNWQSEIIGSTGGDIDDLAVGDGDNDGQNEVYAASEQDNSIYQFKDGVRTLVGTSQYPETVTVGDGDNDGQNEVYAGGWDYVIRQFKWNQTTNSWDNYTVDTIDHYVMTIAVGDGDNDGQNEVYAGSWGGRVYEYKWNATSQQWEGTNIMNASSGIHEIAVGDGDNDGQNEVYVASADHNLYQLGFSGSWSYQIIGTGSDRMSAVAVGDGDNDGQNEVYAGNWNKNLYQFEYMGSSWINTTIGVGEDYVCGIAIGDGDNNGKNEVYAVYGKIHRYEYLNDNWYDMIISTLTKYEEAGIKVGDGDNDGQNEVYAGRNWVTPDGIFKHDIHKLRDIGVYKSSGYFATTFIPNAEDLRIGRGTLFDANQTKPTNTEIRYYFYYFDGTNGYLVPDSVVSGNSVGITNLPIDLTNITSYYPQLLVYIEMSTSDTTVTPAIDSIALNYYARKYTSPEPTYQFGEQQAV